MNLITHEINSNLIPQRPEDGYVSLTRMVKAAGKQINDYLRLGTTKAFLEALSADTGIPVSALVQVRKGGQALEQGTWGHPQVAIHFAQWCSPEFAVLVARWIFDWMSKGIAPATTNIQITPAMLQAISTTTPEQAKAQTKLSELVLVREGFELMTQMKVVERSDLLKLKARVMCLVMSDDSLPAAQPEKAEYSISDRCKELGYTVDQPKLMTIGRRVATLYKERYRVLPAKKEDWVAINVYKKDDLDLLDRAIKAVMG